MKRRFGRLAPLAVVALAWIGCSIQKQTEVVPGAITQIQIPKNLRFVRFDVEAEGQPSTCYPEPVDPSNPGYITLPSTLGVVPSGDSGHAVTITLTGYKHDGSDSDATNINDCLVSPFTLVSDTTGQKYTSPVELLRRARLTYVNGKTLFLPMPLHYACWETPQPCDTNSTCVAGQCVPSSDVDPGGLLEFRPDMVDGTTNLCFNVGECMADQVSAQLEDAAHCIYDFPTKPAGSFVNVRVYYDGGEQEILDLDPQEGFFVPDPTNPQVIELAPGLCQLVQNAGTKAGSLGVRKIVNVSTASLCPSKTVAQPICTGCNVAQELKPLPSALYVLMDYAKSDANNLGPNAIAAALGISFSSPVFRNTYVAFSFMPDVAGNERCTINTSAYANPGVNFDLAPVVQQGVATLFAKNVVPSNDAALAIDAALQQKAAYAAFDTLKASLDGSPPPPTQDQTIFNRLAVMLLFNRDAADSCGLGAATEAQTALVNKGIYTYAIMLQSPSGPTPSKTAAQAIAQAGGTTFIDATDGNLATEGTALAQIISDLGACEYYIPVGMDASWNVSYLLGGVPTSVPQNAQCNAANAASVDGWAVDGDRVRICGNSCTNIKTSLSDASLIAATGQPVPYLPISATQGCK